MKILLLTQVLPYPPDSGPKVKTWNVIKSLALRHEVTLISFTRGDQAHEVEQLRRYCRAVHTVPLRRGALRDGLALAGSLASGTPWVIARDWRGEMGRLVEEISGREAFDVVQADQLNMAQYAARARARLKVLDEHNALWLLYRRMAEREAPGLKRWLFRRDGGLLRRYEGQVCREFDRVIAVSEVDKAALGEVAGPGREMQVIPIAIDTDELPPIQRAAGAGRIVHVGTMFWPPNVDGILWFAHEVLPLIHAVRPAVELDIVGARPPEAVLQLAQADPRIHVTGYVERVEPYLEQAGALIVPVQSGGGMRVKILNQLSQALPMVTTTIGCEGIGVESGRHLLVADSPSDYARAVLQLLDDPALAQALGQAGRRLVQDQYDYRQVCRQLDLVYQA